MWWEARNARRDRRDMVGGAGFGGSGRRFFTESLMRRACVGSPRFSVCAASPERPLWDGDGLGVPDTASGHAGQNSGLGDAAVTFFWSGAPHIAFGDALKDAAEDALRTPCRLASSSA
jgi:hypothetical protein